VSAAAPAAPLLVVLAGRRVVGVGGGRVAAAKLLPLATEHGAAIEVVAPAIDDRLVEVATWHQRAYEGPADLEGAVLVVAATDIPRINERVTADAAAVGALCVRTDAEGDGTAAIPATVRHGPLTIAVGTDGYSPTVSRWLRDELAAKYGPEYGALAMLLGEIRRDPQIGAQLASLSGDQRRLAWRSIPLVDILDLLRSGSVDSAKEVAAACLSSFSD
jgi:precorrin-2 dehydrogenase / sirohydrochlorin ferrochelatase